jgi:hypothetical protein
MLHGRASLGWIFPFSVSLLLSACAGERGEEPLGSAESPITTADVAVTSTNHVAGKVGLPSSLVLRTSATGCLNHPGPFITVEGELTLAGLGAKVIIKNNVQGTHTAEARAEANIEITPKEDKIIIPKGGKYGVGGNPLIALQIFDDYDKPIGGRIELGRCNKLLPVFKVDFSLLSDVYFDVGMGDCMNQGGPNIKITGALTLGGVKAKLYFQNNVKGTRSASEEVEVALVVYPKGNAIVFDKSPRWGNGAGGNPLVFTKLLDYAGNPITDEIFIGRCNKI